MKNLFFAEDKALKQAFLPVDLNAAAITGERVNIGKGSRLAIVLCMGDSVGALVRPTLRQHNAATAGTSKDLSVANAYFHKAGAATSFTKVEPTVAAALYNLDAIFGGEEGIVVFEVLGEDLDVNNGFEFVSIDLADSTAAKIAAAVYVLEPREKSAHSVVL
jgi:hypothetical protein